MPSDKWVTMYSTNVKGFGNALTAGHVYDGTNVSVPVADLIAERTDVSDKFASFATFLSPEQQQTVSRELATRSVTTDTNFISNFSRSLISTPIHAAALVRSWSMQCVGERRWLLFDSAVNPLVNTISTPGVLPMEWTLERALPFAYQGVVRTGDLLYFPPTWLHIVNTRPGFNVMLNLREPRLFNSLMHAPLMTLATIGVRALDKLDDKIAQVNRPLQFNPKSMRNVLDAEVAETFKVLMKNPVRKDDTVLEEFFAGMGE